MDYTINRRLQLTCSATEHASDFAANAWKSQHLPCSLTRRPEHMGNNGTSAAKPVIIINGVLLPTTGFLHIRTISIPGVIHEKTSHFSSRSFSRTVHAKLYSFTAHFLKLHEQAYWQSTEMHKNTLTNDAMAKHRLTVTDRPIVVK